MLSNQGQRSKWERLRSHSLEFINWLQDKVKSEGVTNHIFGLVKGPNPKARRYTGYFINGYIFYTKHCDSLLKTQNSGVALVALTSSFDSSKDQNPVVGDVFYYRVIEDIIEMDFWSQFSIVLFRCDWFHVNVDEFGLTRVNFKRLCYEDDPFILTLRMIHYTSISSSPSFLCARPDRT